MEPIETSLKRVGVFRRDKKYKWRFILYRRLFAGTLCVIVMLLGLLAWTLKGNVALQRGDNILTIEIEKNKK